MRTLPRAGLRATSIADITSRAGVSRSSFFNYFASKSDILWAALDERIAALEERLATSEGADAAPRSAPASRPSREEFAPDSLALALVNADAPWGSTTNSSAKHPSGGRASPRRRRSTPPRRNGAHRRRGRRRRVGGAVLAALEAWAHDGAGRTSLERFFARAAVSADVVTAAARRGAPAARRRAGARLRCGARLLSRCARDAAGRGLRGRGRCTRRDPRRRPCDPRTRRTPRRSPSSIASRPTAARAIRIRLALEVDDTAAVVGASRRRGRRGRGIRSRHAVALAQRARCAARPGCSSRCFQELRLRQRTWHAAPPRRRCRCAPNARAGTRHPLA